MKTADAALGFETGPPLGTEGALGLVVLQTDETVEGELRAILPPTAAFHVTRIPMAAAVTPESLGAMEAALPASARLLPRARRFGTVGYGCTSGATVIGPGRVAELVHGAVDTAHVTDPLTAAIAALRALGARRIGFVTPYLAEVSAAMRARFEEAGIAVAAFASFDESDDATVARIAPASVLDAVRAVHGLGLADAVFLSCTNLQTLSIISAAEEAIGRPVLSSNLALGWHMARLAGMRAHGPGRLLQTP